MILIMNNQTEYIQKLERDNECLREKIESLESEKKCIEEKWQTHAIYEDSEIWSLDRTIAEFVYPRLLRLSQNKGIPGDMKEDEWDDIFNKMVAAFMLIVNEDNYPHGMNDIQQKQIDEGLSLFAKYFQCLWN
jgi:hypothetical protein